ncbi:uncharacterized protein LOC127840970 [Dreissena polymorpha]|nr:uncharacterized protein LOC127840970 [Dreissena polymorpha]
MVAAFVILIGAALGMATVVFQPNNDKPDVPDTDYVISNNGDVNETVSSMLNSVHIPNKRFNLEEINEKQETETQEFTAEQKSASCSGSACSLRNNIFNVSADVDFSEEIQRLFNGEELKFIDES